MVSVLQYKQQYASKELLEQQYYDIVARFHEQMEAGTSLGAEFLGWRTLPVDLKLSEIEAIERTANRLRHISDIVVVVGVGGSYLGARAVKEALAPYFSKKEEGPEVIFAGHNFSGPYMHQLLNYLNGQEVSVIVISKSGTTTEPAVAFRFLYDYMVERYAEQVQDRIIAITDAEKGALRQLADEVGLEIFIVPDDVGGRYSVLTPVGLLPIAVCGINIRQLIEGAKEGVKRYTKPSISENPAYEYAVIRNHLLKQEFDIEVLASFTPNLTMFHEWWKQLFGESEGKNHKGLFPASVVYPTDLHSLGQYIQDGQRNLFETFISIGEVDEDCLIPDSEDNLDGLDYLANRSLHDVSNVVVNAAMKAHNDGGVPTNNIIIGKQDAYHLGNLIYFFETACAMSAYILGVNPFDQPGVEAYKTNMFTMLGKPGYEHMTLKS